MKLVNIVILALIIVGMLFVSGCATGYAGSPPPPPSGGGCGVSAPLGLLGSLASETGSPGAC